MSQQWVEWTQRLQAIAQNGLTYSENPYDLERYQQLQQIAAEIGAVYTQMEPSYILDLFAKEIGYATPKVDVRGVVFQDEQILLVKEREDGCWTLPGGWVDIGESPSEAVVREIYEESGYQTKAVKLLAIYDRNHPRHEHPPMQHHVYKLFFECELLGGNPVENFETEGADFFRESEIPNLSLGRVVPSQIAKFFEYSRRPDWQTDFD